MEQTVAVTTELDTIHRWKTQAQEVLHLLL
jgi:hypothetical protein